MTDLLDEWERLLDAPLVELLTTLTSPSPHACRLREQTPFGGVLSRVEMDQVEQALLALAGLLPQRPGLWSRWPLCRPDCPNTGCRELREWVAATPRWGPHSADRPPNPGQSDPSNTALDAPISAAARSISSGRFLPPR